MAMSSGSLVFFPAMSVLLLILCSDFFFLTDIIKLQELGIYGVLRPGAVCSVSPTFLARSFPIPQQLSFLGPLYSQNEHQ